MDRQQILDLYTWVPGTCFRHPSKGEVPTALVKKLHPAGDGEHEVRACEECVVVIEREAAARLGDEYEPGHVGQPAE